MYREHEAVNNAPSEAPDSYFKEQKDRLEAERRVAALQIAIQFVHTQTCYDCDSLVRDATAILDFIKKG